MGLISVLSAHLKLVVLVKIVSMMGRVFVKGKDMFEIERKFLVTGDVPYHSAVKIEKITQGYLLTDPQKTIRVRLVEELTGTKEISAYLTVKGKTEGFTRREIETLIEFSEASELLVHFCKDRQIIEKVRFTIIDTYNQRWEVDKFTTDNKGLVIAEIELKSEDQEVIFPVWVAGEVTNDHRYSNASLSLCSYPFEVDPNAFER